MQPSTGDILVAANGPGNDGYNMATFGQFAPGSTFKSVSSLALLRDGLTPASVGAVHEHDRGRRQVVQELRRLPLRGTRSDPAAHRRRQLLQHRASSRRSTGWGEEDLVDAAASLGIGVDHDLGFPAYFGSVVPPESETEKAADMIGQGTILASPMAMATVTASIQSGTTVLPGWSRRGTWSTRTCPSLTRAEATALRGMLRGVVTSGSGSLLADVPGPPVIAKTGTAEFEKTARSSPTPG